MEVGGLRGSGHPLAACLPAWGGRGQMVGATIPSPVLLVLQCHLVPCACRWDHWSPLLWGAAGCQHFWVSLPRPAQVRLGEGRDAAEPGERPAGAAGRGGHPPHLPDVVG